VRVSMVMRLQDVIDRLVHPGVYFIAGARILETGESKAARKDDAAPVRSERTLRIEFEEATPVEARTFVPNPEMPARALSPQREPDTLFAILDERETTGDFTLPCTLLLEPAFLDEVDAEVAVLDAIDQKFREADRDGFGIVANQRGGQRERAGLVERLDRKLGALDQPHGRPWSAMRPASSRRRERSQSAARTIASSDSGSKGLVR